MTRKTRVRCFSADMGCLVLGYSQAILSSVTALMEVVYAVMNYVLVNKRDAQAIFLSIFPVIIIAGTMILLAVVLIVGVKQRESGFVMGYLVSGLPITVILFSTVVICMYRGTYYATTLIFFGLLMVYPMCLLMVFSVYNSIKIEEIVKQMNYKNVKDDRYLIAILMY